MSRFRERFADLPLQHKMTVLLLSTCSVVLVLACLALFIFQSITIRANFTRDLLALGKVMADNSAAVVTFKDPEAAGQMLNTLRGHPDIEGARLVLPDGTVLAQFDLNNGHRPEHERDFEEGLRDVGDELLLASRVSVDGKQVGTLYLRADLGSVQGGLLKLYAGILALVLLVALALAFILAKKLQPLITRPILQLASTAQQISVEGDYSIRAPRGGKDEVGVLTNAFNTMLEKVQAQDALHYEIAERKRSEAALRASEQQFRSIAESASDAIVVADQELRILSWNHAATAMFGHTAEQVVGKPLLSILSPRAETGESSADLAETVREAVGETIELSGVRSSGAQFPMEVSVAAWKSEDGVFFSTIIRDISERREAEEALRTSQQRLLETSRRAGMAEIATGVLHNVGNILNSVNIAANVISEKVRKSVTSHLSGIAALIREHEGNLPEFLATDERGKRLPGFIHKLAQANEDERKTLITELELLNKYVVHIKDVVAMQQNYARVSGVIEALQISSLVEDALEMNHAALGRHGVKVTRNFAQVPNVQVDKHKVVQILVNLIRNAKHAMDAAGHERKVLDLTVRATDRDTVCVVVKDNGIGIAPDNLTKIFSHGFTTKTEGHGFGLHTSANAAKEMGGSLKASSDGPGHGATFTLELPIRPMVPATSSKPPRSTAA